MLPSSANALLKTLEEPPKNTLIILISSAPEKLLATIISRCQTIRFCPRDQAAQTEIGKEYIPHIFSYLSKRRTFFEAAQVAKELHAEIEAKKKSFETSLKADHAGQLKDATPAMRQAIEQEIEGALSLFTSQEVELLFYIIQAFFLDLERLQANLPLHFERTRDQVTQAHAHGRKANFARVSKNIREAKLAIERSSPIQNALETLLLELGCV
jgi:DNA polymerase-3 subunit delta'